MARVERQAAPVRAPGSRLVDGVWIEPTPRRVRVQFGGETIADSANVLLVWEPRKLATYWFPVADVKMDRLHASDRGDAHPGVRRFDVRVGDRRADNAAWTYPEPDPERAALGDHVAFFWNQMDAWFEEDDEVFVHPRDPYHRVDVVHSSRHVVVELDGVVVADTTRPRLLFETGLPTRYYIPKVDVRMDLLTRTGSSTQCPYKGDAVYWSVNAGGTIHDDLVWSYPHPILESQRIEDLLSFYNEKVDIIVDGERQPRPATRWS